MDRILKFRRYLISLILTRASQLHQFMELFQTFYQDMIKHPTASFVMQGLVKNVAKFIHVDPSPVADDFEAMCDVCDNTIIPIY